VENSDIRQRRSLSFFLWMSAQFFKAFMHLRDEGISQAELL